MATAPRRTRAKTPLRDPSEGKTASEVVASSILASFSDLAPSVRRIMDSDLDEAGRLRAIGLFRDSLGVIGDPMRIPSNAIAAGRLVAEPG